ncbi:hypothetical protein PBAL39_13377 [Pedobacter sp. BAL39]|uniref:RHS repeat domain-containing protein n=1 Tax=Pedobacter sp. BAL39 TaxID=391596 RepID=UPI000155995D|nr:RHS repeat-associated core domain-containing protein [Pedobacter sp. BAL39]EDM35226.1 hypothetical protein PBAL39_13377 [Pedobacter sp. BAL39]
MAAALRNTLCLFFLLILFAVKGFASVEPYDNFIKGQLRKNDTLLVKDEKFNNPLFNWSDITNISVQNAISLRVIDEQAISRDFSCKIALKIEYFSVAGQTVPTVIDSVKLNVNYSKQSGAVYKNIDTYKFKDGFQVKVTILDISSPEFGTELPPVLQLNSHILIDRKYLFKPFLFIGVNGQFNSAGGKMQRLGSGSTTNNGNQLLLSWSLVQGAEEYDVEWVTIDEGSEWAKLAKDMTDNSPSLLDDQLDAVFRNNATRITTHENNYLISLLYNAKYIAVRMRQVQYDLEGIRLEGQWFYKQDNTNTYSIWPLSWHEPTMNWQYEAAFAEEGKKKEVVSYLDGTLRGRQNVTLNNSDDVAVVQENVYDQFGRVAANILPAPVKETALTTQYLHYFKGFNKNLSGNNYNFNDLNNANCEPFPNALSTSSGAGKYYSGQNQFINDKLYNKYIPDAEGYPLSVTQYTADNTGRIKLQGGVGPVFQPGIPGESHTSKNYYGKPEQWELDRIFGNDAGYAEHYLKNMVVDPNGQISVSYLNAAGKAVATALTGKVPANVDSLDSRTIPKSQITHLLKPDQFKFSGTDLKLTATTTFLAAVTGADTLGYDVEQLISFYPGGAFEPCSNCYYDLTITVTDDCGNPVYRNVEPVKIGSATSKPAQTGIFADRFPININQIGEYYVTFEFALSRDVIEHFTNEYVTEGQTRGVLKQQSDFILQYLQASSFDDCFSDCKTAVSRLGSKGAFTAMVKAKLAALGDASNSYDVYISTLYDGLLVRATALQASCATVTSPCDVYRTPMLIDVSPGGQYAMIDSAGNLLEPLTNVLSLYFRHGAFDELSKGSPIYQANLITKDDGTVTSPYDINFTIADLIKYWRPEWAEQFIVFHPEYCKLLFCMENSASSSWDEQLQETVAEADLATLLNGNRYDRSNPIWLLSSDPFFQAGSAGFMYRDSIAADLTQYSRSVLKQPGLALKNICQVVDFQLYCADASGTTNQQNTQDTWLNCTPVEDCRVIDREWEFYRDMYLELKQLYFQRVRKETTCLNSCEVGTPIKVPEVIPEDCIYDGPTTNSDRSVAGQAISGLLDAMPNGAIEMWTHNTSGASRQFITASPDMKYMVQSCINGNLLSVDLFSLSQYSPDNVNIDLSKHFSVDISDQLPLKPWLHVVYQSVNGVSEIWVGGKKYPLLPDAPPAGCSWEITSSPLTMPDNFDDLHHLRLYTGRSMTAYEIAANAASKCFLASDHTAMRWFRFNVPGSMPLRLARANGALVQSCPETLLTKVPRFVVIDTEGLVSSTPGAVTEDVLDRNNILLAQQIRAAVEGMSEVWISRLQPGLDLGGYSSETVTVLKTKLSELAIAGGDMKHPMGASSLPAGQTIMVGSQACHNFGEVIKSVLGLNGFTNELNPWLLDAPDPYDVKSQTAELVISNSSADICAKLNALNTGGWNTSEFYAQLSNRYGRAMTLSPADFAVLIKGCTNCKYLLSKDTKLPVFLQAESKGCISRAEYTAAMADLASAFNGVPDSTWSNREVIVANYLNQKWGFGLGYDTYSNFASGTADLLCNEPPYDSVEEDVYACAKSLIELAFGYGSRDYELYIAEEKLKFRSAYINTCAAAKSNVRLYTKQQIYHYTLFYYDQAGNLVRTVPPEGVTFLTDKEMELVDKVRDRSDEYCNYDGPASVSNKVTALSSLSQTLQNTTNSAVEMWLHNDIEGGRQFISATPDMKYMLHACQNGKLLTVEIFSLSQTAADNVRITLTNRVTADIEDLLPLSPWMHVVVQGMNMGQGNLEIYVNGKRYDAVPGAPSAGCSWSIRSNPLRMPDNFESIKHLRTYLGRLMTPAEIAANAESSCFLASNHLAMSWYRFNVPPMGGPTTIADNSTQETQYNGVYPKHGLLTTYAYNTTNQVVKQRTPDGGTSKFWYDYLSRLVVSQNAKQVENNNFSYTKFDVIGRTVEVGQKRATGTGLADPEYLSSSSYQNFLGMGSDSQITQTVYDVQPAASSGVPENLNLRNLRKRVSASIYRDFQGPGFSSATFYDYDLTGNVKTLYQQIIGLDLKKLDYEYDLVSGKVNFLSYQHGANDQFYYQYKYDAENRLTEAWTSTTANVSSYGVGSSLADPDRRLDASYQYYLHGPLARIELGHVQSKVQGVDYAYTLQGWLKGVNGTALGGSAADMGNDRSVIAADALAYTLGYYSSDYKPIGGTNAMALNQKYEPLPDDITGSNLYNGNISNSSYAIAKIGTGSSVGYSYRYDQLNRLKKMRQHAIGGNAVWNGTSMTNAFKEDFNYDGNGNILALQRNSQAVEMDNLTYGYSRDVNGKLLNNKLTVLNDAVAGSNQAGELKGQSKYVYDAIGNLISDANNGVFRIEWNVYGKISTIIKGGQGVISFEYDGSGNRTRKIETTSAGTSTTIRTYYVRDASGNTIATYGQDATETKSIWQEQHLYGSNRLGVWNPNVDLTVENGTSKWDSIGKKSYELSNHLGNVMSVISDNRLVVEGGYQPDILNAQDYYAFGSLMPERKFAGISGKNYRYGFNGKENDNEVKGEGNQQDYGMRIYDPRVGRFLSVDPLTREYPWYTPYSYAGNMPIRFIDIDGMEQGPPRFYFEPMKYSGKNTVADYAKTIPNAATGVVNGVIGLLYMASDELNAATTTFSTGSLPFDYKDVKTSVHKMGQTISANAKELTKKESWSAEAFKNALKNPETYQQTMEMGAALYTMSRPVIGKVTVKNAGANVSMGNVSFGSLASKAAERLGFFAEEVSINGGVADIPIIYMTKVTSSDLTAVSNALRENGATAMRINSGPIINKSISGRLSQAAKQGKEFMGFKVTETGNSENMFVLDKKL